MSEEEIIVILGPKRVMSAVMEAADAASVEGLKELRVLKATGGTLIDGPDEE